MPTANFDIQRWTVGVGTVQGVASVPLGYTDRRSCGIRRVDPNEPDRYRHTGDVLASAYFETEPLRVSALTEVFAVDWRLSDEDDVALVEVQVSLDDGVTYLAWTGAAWGVQAADGTYNSREIFNDNCATLPVVNPRCLAFRVQLTRRDDGDSPVLTGFDAFVEYDQNFHEDVYITLKAILEAATFPVQHRVQMTSGATFTLSSNYSPATIPAFEIFNLTTDAYENTDIFHSYNSTSKLVTLTGAVLDDDVLMVRFDGKAPVVLARKDEMISLSSLPVTVARLANSSYANERDIGIVQEFKHTTLEEDRLVRIREYPRLLEVEIEVEHWTPFRRVALVAVRAIRERMTNLRSHATAETFGIVELEPGEMSEGTESFIVGKWKGAVQGFAHTPHYTEHKTADLDFRMNLGEIALRSEEI